MSMLTTVVRIRTGMTTTTMVMITTMIATMITNVIRRVHQMYTCARGDLDVDADAGADFDVCDGTGTEIEIVHWVDTDDASDVVASRGADAETDACVDAGNRWVFLYGPGRPVSRRSCRNAGRLQPCQILYWSHTCRQFFRLIFRPISTSVSTNCFDQFRPIARPFFRPIPTHRPTKPSAKPSRGHGKVIVFGRNCVDQNVLFIKIPWVL